ncbi:glucosaminidase domain-containing protein [Planococcus lenghuensis]|nr:glucosaminidase domain-containing protein [Planococcus lenghuensis]
MSRMMPTANPMGNTNNPMTSAADPNSFFFMLMNAMMSNMGQTSAVAPQSNGMLNQAPNQTSPVPSMTITFTAPLSNAYNPAIPTVQSVVRKDVPTSAGDMSDFKFQPTQFLKLDQNLEGKLEGTAGHFIAAGKKYDINPNLLSAIAIHETGNGGSRAANDKNNIAGMMGKNGLRSYATVEDSIFDMARNLRQNYLNEGKDSIAKIGAKYAPVGAANDPTGLNNHWTKGVSHYYNSLT